MNAVLLVVTLIATPPTDTAPVGPQLAPPDRARRMHRMEPMERMRPRQRMRAASRRAGVPPLRWERIIKKCGAPCLIWARHILDAATSPGGFRLQILGLARAARRALSAGRLHPHHALKVKQAVTRLGLALRRMTADGLLTHRERMLLLKGIIRTGAALHRATRVTRPWVRPGVWHRGLRGFRRAPTPPPAPGHP